MSDAKISVYIICKNNEKTISEVLSAITDADEIVLVDSGSTDNTLAIAESFSDQTTIRIYHQDWLGFSQQKAKALSLCQHKWALCLDSDEVLEPEGISKLKMIIKATPSVNGYSIKRREFMDHKPIYVKRKSFVRLYRKSKAEWQLNRLVHEHINIEGEILPTRINIDHHHGLSYETLRKKSVHYATLKAEQKYRQHKSTSDLKIMLIYPVMLANFLIIRGYLLGGIRGIKQANIFSLYFLNTEKKLKILDNSNSKRSNNITK